MLIDETGEQVDPAAVSRRHVLRRFVAFGLVAPVGMTVLQACGGEKPKETPKPAEPTKAATTAPGATTPKATPKATP
jgi:hypothetical protein